VKGRGNPNANIFLVGEAYGSYEEAAQAPFVGPAGRVLREMLLKSGIDPDHDVYYSNIVNARPPGNDLSKWISKGVPNDIVLDGVDSLISEVESVQPNVIMPLGNWPLWFFYGQKMNKDYQPVGITDYRGYILEARKICKGRKILPTLHPSYYLRGNYSEAGLGILDFKKAEAQSHFPDIRRQERKYYIDPQGAEREVLRQRLLNEGDILFTDIEYIGSSLKCIGFSVSPDWAVTIKIRGLDDIGWCRSLIESGKALGAQNAMFDFGILEWHYDIHGFENLVYDTMVAAYVINIEHKKDLGFLGSMYTDMDAWWDVIDWGKVSRGEQSIDELLPYNCGDNVVTCEVAQKQMIELKKEPKYWEAFQFDMAKLHPLWKISKRGVPIDADKLLAIKAKVTHDLDQGQAALNEIVDAFGMDRHGVDFNVKSGPQVTELLAAWMEVELTKRTPGGKQWATDNVILMEYMRRSDNKLVRNVIEKIIQVREARDIDSKWNDIKWDDDLRARCTYDATKTVTRRLSSKKFFPTGLGTNLQNIPAPNSSPRYGGLIRGCFVPDSGLEFGYADLKGAEFLIVAWQTQDPLMLRYAEMSITGVGNVHKETASFLFNKPVEEIDKESMYYFLGKKMRHSGNYMVGWKELMGRINAEALDTGVWVDAAQTKKLISGYTSLHPMLPSWWDEVRREAKETGRLRNLFGFIRVINDRVDNCLPELVAYIPQSTVGDCLNYGLLACENDPVLREYNFSILLQVHDAIGFQYNPNYRVEVLSRVHELMSIPIYIPKTAETKTIPIELQIGKAWHPLEEYLLAKKAG
jgi:uracil-DNA glycosylase family 4